MTSGAPKALVWRKSTASASEGCLEVAHDASHTHVRDSKDPHGGQLLLTHDEWRQFVEAVRTGGYDLP
jgi:hypothetical protein